MKCELCGVDFSHMLKWTDFGKQKLRMCQDCRNRLRFRGNFIRSLGFKGEKLNRVIDDQFEREKVKNRF